MFVPRAHVYIGKAGKKRGWFSSPSQRNRQPRHKLKYYEYIRMPCLIPTSIGTVVGVLLILMGGFMCFVGYNPSFVVGDNDVETNSTSLLTSSTNPSASAVITSRWKYPGLRSLAYVGPIFMGIGFFVMMVAVVLYCEIKEKYVTHVLPGKNIRNWKKDELYDMIIDEFRKNYFRGIEVPLRTNKKSSAVEKDFPTLCKALSISTPAILITPEIQPRKWAHARDTPASLPKSKSRRVSRVRENDTWMKTSSLPNIRRKSLCRDLVNKGTGNRPLYDNMSKSCDNPKSNMFEMTEKTPDTTGVDNPAFRSSPTEKNKYPIKFTFTVDSPDSSPGDHVTKVMVHKDASLEKTANDTFSSLSLSLADSDKRGLTLKRHSFDVSDTYSSASRQISDCDSISVNDVDDVIINFESGDEEQKQKIEMSRVKSLYNFTDTYSTDSGVKLDTGQSGIHKTSIAVFHSDSCLDIMRRGRGSYKQCHDDDDDDDDNTSIDSLCLKDDDLKIFETTT